MAEIKLDELRRRIGDLTLRLWALEAEEAERNEAAMSSLVGAVREPNPNLDPMKMVESLESALAHSRERRFQAEAAQSAE